jgi:hypothetical protein
MKRLKILWINKNTKIPFRLSTNRQNLSQRVKKLQRVDGMTMMRSPLIWKQTKKRKGTKQRICKTMMMLKVMLKKMMRGSSKDSHL